jgi:DNA-binding NarL/FixJ family response regulator
MRQTKPNFSAAMNWLLTSEIQLKVGVVSSQRLMLFGLYHLVSRKRCFAFMASSKLAALEGIQRHQPGILIITPDLDQADSGIEVVEQAHQLAGSLCSILIVNSSRHDPNLAFKSKARAVICEEEIFTPGDPQDQLIISLAQGKSYRSPALKALIADQKLTAEGRQGQPPALTGRELAVAALLMEGCNDRQIAERLGMAYTTVRTHGRSLRQKFSVTNRSQLVLQLIHFGLEPLQSFR